MDGFCMNCCAVVSGVPDGDSHGDGCGPVRSFADARARIDGRLADLAEVSMGLAVEMAEAEMMSEALDRAAGKEQRP